MTRSAFANRHWIARSALIVAAFVLVLEGCRASTEPSAQPTASRSPTAAPITAAPPTPVPTPVAFVREGWSIQRSTASQPPFSLQLPPGWSAVDPSPGSLFSAQSDDDGSLEVQAFATAPGSWTALLVDRRAAAVEYGGLASDVEELTLPIGAAARDRSSLVEAVTSRRYYFPPNGGRALYLSFSRLATRTSTIPPIWHGIVETFNPYAATSPAALAEWAQPNPVAVSLDKYGLTYVGGSTPVVYYGIVMTNPNETGWIARDIQLNITFYLEDGTIAGVRQERIPIGLPGETFGIGDSFYPDIFGKITRLSVAFRNDWEAVDHPVGEFVPTPSSYVVDGYSSVNTGTIASTFRETQELVEVVIIFTDLKGRVRGGAHTVLDFVPPDGKVAFQITTPHVFPDGDGLLWAQPTGRQSLILGP